MFAKETIAEITNVADEFGFEPAALLAVAEVESGGQVFAIIDDKPEPIIRFEGHYFDKRLTPEKQLKARADGLASPYAGKIANPRTQAGRWRLLTRAAAIDRKAAYESVSWGLGQVMGAHWAWLGYATVDEMVDEARNGAAGQSRLMARYIEKAGLGGALTARNWAAFAKGYNGPDFRRYRYHTKIAAAYKAYQGMGAPAPANRVLGLGASGVSVRKLQVELAREGLLVEADGMFGRRTERAVREFQRMHGLIADGIAGPATLARLRERNAAPSQSSAASRLMASVANLFRTA